MRANASTSPGPVDNFDVPIEVRVEFNEIHARYRPEHGYAQWWVVLIGNRRPYFDLIDPNPSPRNEREPLI